MSRSEPPFSTNKSDGATVKESNSASVTERSRKFVDFEHLLLDQQGKGCAQHCPTRRSTASGAVVALSEARSRVFASEADVDFEHLLHDQRDKDYTNTAQRSERTTKIHFAPCVRRAAFARDVGGYDTAESASGTPGAISAPCSEARPAGKLLN